MFFFDEIGYYILLPFYFYYIDTFRLTFTLLAELVLLNWLVFNTIDLFDFDMLVFAAL